MMIFFLMDNLEKILDKQTIVINDLENKVYTMQAKEPIN